MRSVINNEIDCEVIVMEPHSLEELSEAILALWQYKSVLLNLTKMTPQQAQRAVDFVAGGTYAMEGHQERVGENIFLFTPSCIEISKQSDVIDRVPQPQELSGYLVAFTPVEQ